MTTLIKETKINSKGWYIGIFDKTIKNVDYNYLVEVSLDGKSTKYSRFFEAELEAESYFKKACELIGCEVIQEFPELEDLFKQDNVLPKVDKTKIEGYKAPKKSWWKFW